MGWQDDLANWRSSTPKEERKEKVINVIEKIFHNWKWNKRGSHIVVKDERLKYYKREINTYNKNISHEGSFHVPTIKGRKILGVYIDIILDMIDIIEAYERTRK